MDEDQKALLSLLTKTMETLITDGCKGNIVVGIEDEYPAGIAVFSKDKFKSWDEFIDVLKEIVKEQNKNNEVN